MRIVTRCKTPEQFIAAFHRFCDAKTCFIPSIETRPVGSALAFSLRLADGTPMLRGSCIVKAAWKTNDNEFKRPGVQLEITKLHPESAALYEQMLSQKTAVMIPQSDGVVQAIKPVTTNQHVPRDKAIDLILRQGNAPVVTIPMKPPPLPGAATSDDENPTQPVRVSVPPEAIGDAKPTTQMPPLQYPSETRTPGSAIVLPANPLSDVDERALDEMLGCTLAEEADQPEGVADDLAIPVLGEPPSLPAPPSRDEIATTIGVAPLRQKTAPIPVVLRPIARAGTQPLALDLRPPASPSMFNLHEMTAEERLWLMCALGGALLVAAIVLASAFVFSA